MTLFGLGGLRGEIVSLLADSQRLSVKEIFLRLKKKGVGVSYQAVHKSLLELVSEKVLEKLGKEYSISSKWLDQMQLQLDNIRTKIFHLEEALPEQSNFVFDSIADLDSFLINMFLQMIRLRKEKSKPVLGLQWNHFWLPLFEREDYLHSRQLGAFSKAYSLSRGDTVIDRWCSDFWGKNRVTTKTGCNIANVADIVAFEDLVIEVFYPKEIRRLLDQEYNKIKKMSQLDVDALFEKVFQKKTKIPVVIFRNALVADRIKQQTIDFCKK